MAQPKKNTAEDAVKALEGAFKLLNDLNKDADDTGACVWVTPSGSSVCAQLTPEQCSLIDGASYLGGNCPTN